MLRLLPCSVAASTSARCSFPKATCCRSCSVLHSSSESVSKFPGWRVVPELYSLASAGSRAGPEILVFGFCASASSVQRLYGIPDLVVLLSTYPSFLKVATKLGTFTLHQQKSAFDPCTT